ncbi:hypothetical protein GGF31_008949 [Allomyces arbusculus]|nr:hypothetical protein GGF31_008949 [Allomyces arbusculus]
MQPARRTSGDSSDSDNDDAPEAVSLTASKDQHRTRARAERGAVTSAKQAVKDRNRARDAAIKAQKPARGGKAKPAAPVAPASDDVEEDKDAETEADKEQSAEEEDADALPADFLQQLAAREDEEDEDEEEEDDGPRATIDIAASKSFKFDDDDDEFDDDDLMDLDDDDDSPSLPAGLEVVPLTKLASADVATPPVASAANFLEMRLRKTARRQPILNSLSRAGQPALDMAAKPGLLSGSKSGRDLRLKKTKRAKKGGVGKSKARR